MSPVDLGVKSDNPTTTDIIDTLRLRLNEAANSLCGRLKQLHDSIENKILAFAYFDEAHTLHKVDESGTGRNPYFIFMHVLSQLQNSPIFFIFLSTNPSLSTFALTDADYPSLRVQKGWKIIPPFFELPFDSFCYGLSKTLRDRGKLTLKNVCELEQVVKFGRPMWVLPHSSMRMPNSHVF
jgi:hypothetical protein